VASPLRSARALVSRNRLATGVIAGVVAAGLLTATLVPAMASARVSAEDPISTPAPTTSAAPVTPTAPAPTPTASEPAVAVPVAEKPKKPKKPKPASATRKARNVPEFPRDKHTGKRLVYDKALMTVWLMNKDNEVVARYPVVGRFDRPAKGVYKVYSKSPKSGNPFSKVTFNYMVRFAWGLDSTASIGFHDIPMYYDGTMMHSQKQLGLAIARGGCVRLSPEAAKHIYRFAKIGTKVVVLPSP
jgi:hypothetical protein